MLRSVDCTADMIGAAQIIRPSTDPLPKGAKLQIIRVRCKLSLFRERCEARPYVFGPLFGSIEIA